MALVKSLVQRLNEPLLAGHQALLGSRSPLRGGGPRKVRLDSPRQPVAVIQEKGGQKVEPLTYPAGPTLLTCLARSVLLPTAGPTTTS